MRLELRHGSARPIPHDVASVSFLVGTVPGCDLRLPGAALPAVCCLITRRPEGVELRKLAPIGPLLVNGQPAGTQRLNNGDRITLGAVELLVHIAEPQARHVPAVRLVPIPIAEPVAAEPEETATARRELAEIREQLYDRYRRRRDRLAGLHEAIRRAARKVQERKGEVEAEARAVAARREEESVRQAHLDARTEELARDRALFEEEQ